MGYVGQAPSAGGVTSADIVDGTIVSADLGDNQVTLAKVADIARGSIVVGNASAATAELTKGGAATVLTSDGTDVAWAAAGGGGDADIWRLTTNTTGDGFLTANLERADTDGQAYTGTSPGMTQSSGIFTFPSTGTWMVQYITMFVAVSNTDTVCVGQLHTTTNNSTYAVAASTAVSLWSASTAHSQGIVTVLLNVDNVSNVKVKFDRALQEGTNYLAGSTVTNLTSMYFQRVGDST